MSDPKESKELLAAAEEELLSCEESEEEAEVTPVKPAWIPFRQRPEWQDIEPVPQDDGPNPVVPISYTPQFSETMDYFRAILKRQEKSLRALELCQEVIKCNPANYCAWWYRREVLFALNSDLVGELEWCKARILGCPKNYQSWHHRRVLVERTGDPSQEKEVVTNVLLNDSKTYHAWSHRRWCVQTFNLWDGEVEFTSELIAIDVRNNSAWNYRYFVMECHEMPCAKESGDTGVLALLQAEIKYAESAILKAPNNESPYNYLLGILPKRNTNFVGLWHSVAEYLEAIAGAHPVCPVVRSALLRLHERIATGDMLPVESAALEVAASRQKIAGLADDLVKLDPVRKKYWAFLGAQSRASLQGQ
eukprot:TRINITY_DN56874_c0_g1_i1.p1 TRINITY_DN56874_c0_g1~~TRINITY_DN56874_c0_g1_i1.p1  ORF type:complete len:372 (-),score=60.03 TRINITY_DN56874_c0_g1_i1:107-1195(-)